MDNTTKIGILAFLLMTVTLFAIVINDGYENGDVHLKQASGWRYVTCFKGSKIVFEGVVREFDQTEMPGDACSTRSLTIGELKGLAG